MAAKISILAYEAIFSCKVAYLIGFDLPRTKICIINTFEEQLPIEKNTVKFEKKLKMVAPTRRYSKVETSSLI